MDQHELPNVATTAVLGCQNLRWSLTPCPTFRSLILLASVALGGLLPSSLAGVGYSQLAPEDSSETYYEVLGQGSYGTVYRLPDDKATVVKVSDFSWNSYLSLVNLREVFFLNHLNHPHIIKPKKAELIHDAHGMKLEMFLPYGTVPQRAPGDLLAAGSQALAYLHQLGMAHEDLKPQHLLEVDQQTKMLDFGSCSLDINRPSDHNKTTLYYRSPENLFGEYGFEQALDIWSLAITILRKQNTAHQLDLVFSLGDVPDANDRMIYGLFKSLGTPQESQPFFKKWLQTKTDLTLFNSRANSYERYPIKAYPAPQLEKLYPELSAELLEALRRMLDFNPSTRITAEELTHLPLIAAASNNLRPATAASEPKQLFPFAQATQHDPILSQEFAMLAALCESLDLDDYIFFESAGIFAQMDEKFNATAQSAHKLALWESAAIYFALVLYDETVIASDLLTHQFEHFYRGGEFGRFAERFLNKTQFSIIHDHAFRLASRQGSTKGPQGRAWISALKAQVISEGRILLR